MIKIKYGVLCYIIDTLNNLQSYLQHKKKQTVKQLLLLNTMQLRGLQDKQDTLTVDIQLTEQRGVQLLNKLSV